MSEEKGNAKRLVSYIAISHLNVNAAKQDLFFTCLTRKETQNVSFAISLNVISIQHASVEHSAFAHTTFRSCL